MRTSALKLPHVLHLSRTQLLRPGHALGMLQYDGRIIWKPPAASEDQLAERCRCRHTRWQGDVLRTSRRPKRWQGDVLRSLGYRG